MITATLRAIAHQLRTQAEEPEISRDALYLAARRLEAQAEMIEEGCE